MKIIIMALAMTFAFCAQAQDDKTTVIDFDYSKSVRIDVLAMDLDGDGELTDDEKITVPENLEWTVKMDYKDFGSAGNFLTLTVRTEEPDGNVGVMTGRLEDVLFVRTLMDKSTGYGALNKLGEVQFSVLTMDGLTMVSILNAAFLNVR